MIGQLNKDNMNYWLDQNKNHDIIPAVLHGQGPAKHTLIGISNYVPGAFTDFYGTKRHTHMQGANIYPLVIGLFFAEETDVDHETQFIASIKALNIDKSQTHLFVTATRAFICAVCALLLVISMPLVSVQTR